jgi:ankyrin repeat protein
MPWTPLHIAIADEADVKVHEWAQDGTIMQWLNETDDAGVTPLHLASETSQTEIVQASRDCLCFVPYKIVTQRSVSFFCRSAAFRLREPRSTSQRPCTSRPKKDVFLSSAFSPLQVSASTSCPKPFSPPHAGADVNAAALEGLTPLHEAARYGYMGED